MSRDSRPLLIAAAGAAALAAMTLLRRRAASKTEDAPKKSVVRAKLPPDLHTWRHPGEDEQADHKIWDELRDFFNERGYALWSHSGSFALLPPPGQISANGFGYATSSRDLGVFYNYEMWEYNNAVSRAARTRTGHDVIVRVLVVGDQGRRHLDILRKIARGSQSLFSNNHTLPMFDELHLGDVVFGVFPKSGMSLDFAYGRWPENSVGDIVDMILQALEGLAFLHSAGIAHRDVFRSNFMAEWMPESLLYGTISPSRPRVYLIDFEAAVEFPADCPREQRHCVGLPLGDTMTAGDYVRPVPPEVASGRSYDPFPLDVWQFGTTFADFKSTISAVDDALFSMRHEDASLRRSAAETLTLLSDTISGIPPSALFIKPDIPET